MKFFKAAMFFALSFVAAWVIIFTFIQPPFHQAVPAKLLWYQTEPYPIYYYLIGALAIGLTIGLIISAYYYVTFSAKLHKARKETRQVQEELETLRTAPPPAEQTTKREPPTAPPPDTEPPPRPAAPEPSTEEEHAEDDILFEVKPMDTDQPPSDAPDNENAQEDRPGESDPK